MYLLINGNYITVICFLLHDCMLELIGLPVVYVGQLVQTLSQDTVPVPALTADSRVNVYREVLGCEDLDSLLGNSWLNDKVQQPLYSFLVCQVYWCLSFYANLKQGPF